MDALPQTGVEATPVKTLTQIGREATEKKKKNRKEKRAARRGLQQKKHSVVRVTSIASDAPTPHIDQTDDSAVQDLQIVKPFWGCQVQDTKTSDHSPRPLRRHKAHGTRITTIISVGDGPPRSAGSTIRDQVLRRLYSA